MEGFTLHFSDCPSFKSIKRKGFRQVIEFAESLYFERFSHIFLEPIVSKCGFTYPMEYQVLKFRIYSLSNTYINWLASIICSIASLFVHERFSCAVGFLYAAKVPSNIDCMPLR